LIISVKLSRWQFILGRDAALSGSLCEGQRHTHEQLPRREVTG
jgi:hypothetical protein